MNGEIKELERTPEEKLALIEIIAEKQQVTKTGDDDLKYLEEVATLTIEKFRAELSHESKKRWLKIGFAFLLFLLVVFWLLVVLVYIGFAGFKYLGFELPEAVLIAFITSTTVSVIGLFHYVAKWLYVSDGAPELPSSEVKRKPELKE